MCIRDRLVSGEKFSITQYLMSDDVDDIQHPRYHMRHRIFFNLLNMYVWICMGLDGSTCSESLPEGTCHFEPPEHVPRTSGPNLSMGSGRAPDVPRSREHEERPPAKREKNVEG